MKSTSALMLSSFDQVCMAGIEESIKHRCATCAK
jgi:hypothetical protein